MSIDTDLEGSERCIRRDSMERNSTEDDSAARRRVLIVYPTARDQTCAIANAIAEQMRARGIDVEVGDASTGVMPPPQDYDAVVVGVSAGFGPRTWRMERYIQQNRAGLVEVPSALFTVGESSDTEAFVRTVRWKPDLAVELVDETARIEVTRFADWMVSELAAARAR